MSTFGRPNRSLPRDNRDSMHFYDDVVKSGSPSTRHRNQAPHSIELSRVNHQTGQSNPAYSPTTDDHVPSTSVRPSANGHSNRAFIPSGIDFDRASSPNNNSNHHIYTIPTKEPQTPTTHDPGRYIDIPDGQKPDSGFCSKKRCIVAFIVIIALALVTVGVVLGLFFGTDLISQRSTSPSTTTQPASETTTTAVAPATTTSSNETIYNETTTAVIVSTTNIISTTSTANFMTTTSAEVTSEKTFSGTVRVDQQWMPELNDPDSQQFKNISSQFIELMDEKMKSDPELGSIYNGTDVLNMMSGSIIIIFRIRFNQPTEPSIVLTRVTVILEESEASSQLTIIVDSLVITGFNETTACGDDSRLLCNDVCRSKSLIACDGKLDCADWIDEHNCPGQSVTCDFESSETCGYTIESKEGHDYKWVYNSGSTGTIDTGPEYDHTFMNSSGHYYYTEWCRGCEIGAIALMTSPYYVTRQPACLSFWYNMKGHPTEMGPLYLYSLDNFDNEKVLWTRENPDADDRKGLWSQVKVNVPAGSYRFIFGSMFRDETEQGDKAIDDIAITEGICTDTPECGDSFFCPVLYECLDSRIQPLCNGRFDCPDQSDEENCDGYHYKCSFERKSFDACELTVEAPSDELYTWRIFSSSTPDERNQGTYYDHTYKNDLGHYASVLPGASSVGSQAKLKTKTLTKSFQRCLQLAYQMNDESGTETAILKVIVVKSGGENVELWKQEGRVGRDWQQLIQTIPAFTEDYHVEITVVRGDGNSMIVSIDDFTIKDGFCLCPDAGRKQCPGSTCIPNEWFCDGAADCPDGSDELNCGSCSTNEYQCKDLSCVSGGESVRCDRNYDCADGSDEDGCATVDFCGTEDCVKVQHTDGKFYEVCASEWDPSLNPQICRYLYKKSTGASSGGTAASAGAAKFLKLTTKSSSGFRSLFSVVDSCPQNQVIKVSCEEEVCGRPDSTFSPYIIGGWESNVQGRWPWQVDLKYAQVHSCGATLLNKHYLITAAHCVSKGTENTPELFTVTLGSTKVQPPSAGSVTYNVTRIILHPDYTGIFSGSDIALLFIEKEIQFTQYIKPACLPELSDIYSTRSYCYITGWGVQVLNPETYPNILQEAKYKFLDMSNCNQSWINADPSVPISEKMLCAGYESGTVRTCKGDSGGPLVCKDKYQRWSLAGITSFGAGGCLLQNHKPDIFTKVTSFLPWLTDIINFEFKCNSGKVILDAEKLCNGEDDCGDNSDETRACPVNVTCTFETRNNCGYKVNGLGWYRASGLASEIGPLDNTGPSYDHTTGLDYGSHSYLLTSTDGATFSSPTHNSTSSSCLEFYYFISSASNSITLFKSSAGGEVIATAARQAQTWQRLQTTLPAGSYPITFKAHLGDESSYVAIDDVNVVSGSCSTKCPLTKLKCSSDNTCIDLMFKCNGVQDCADGSDELNCLVISQVECSFDKPFACGLLQSDSDDFNWKFQYGPAEFTSSTGPRSGHREGDEVDISYLLAKAPNQYDVSILTWPIKLQSKSCFSFFYHMRGVDVGSLVIRSKGTTLWQRTGNTESEDWFQAHVEIPANQNIEILTQSAGKPSNHIALDDFTVKVGSCPLPKLCDSSSEIACGSECLPLSKQCDKQVDCFDLSDELLTCRWSTDCDFSSDCTSYSTSQSQIYRWSHDVTGKYLVADASSADIGAQTSYTSAPFSLATVKCVTFKYKLEGGVTSNSELRVRLMEPYVGKITTMWRMSLTRERWTGGRVTLPPTLTSGGRLQFQALYGGNKSSDIYLDDIKMTEGACHMPDCSGSLLCPYEEICIPLGKKCDGVNDCHGGTDEADCGGLAELIDCDFDEDLCKWQTLPSDLQLIRGSGSTPREATGPSNDHTQESLLGYYLYLDSTDTASQATLISHTFKLSTPHCFNFYFHMLGASVGFLNLTNVNATSGQQLLFSILGAQQQTIWHKAKITLPAAEAVTLLFTMSTRGRYSNIALDDFFLREGVCSCDDTDEFQCGPHGGGAIRGECLESAVRCDLRNQCIDAADEADCSGCPNNDYKCADGSGDCVPIVNICTELIMDCVAANHTIDCSEHCGQNDFVCKRGFCLPIETFCNGHPDCPDADDELPGCGSNCPSGLIACANQATCIPVHQFCDGHVDCNDKSDELAGCEPLETSTEPSVASDCANNTNFMCKENNQIISRSNYCDGRVDCLDASDEPPNCECCAASEFTCLLVSACIDALMRCDGKFDCADYSDEVGCVCGDEQFRCDEGLCISNMNRCDGVLDCNDWSDETSCTCGSSQFRCGNSRCVDQSYKCDGKDDCLDNSDESDCPCRLGEVRCLLSKKCIPAEYVCDGYIDCSNGTEEQNCESCPEFTCANKRCISNSSVCNMIDDCGDNSEESGCITVDNASAVKILFGNTTISKKSYYICSDGWKTVYGQDLCTKSGLGQFKTAKLVTLDDPPSSWLSYSSNGAMEVVFSCNQNYVVGVECESLECGWSSKMLVTPYIVGGDVVETAEEWPWVVAIYYSGKFTGAGVYIGNGWVMSAAHLVKAPIVKDGVRFIEQRDLAPHLFHVEMTSLKRGSSSSAVANVTKIVTHPSLTVQPTLRHDLALFKIMAGSTVTPVPVCRHQSVSDFCYVVGWGSVDGKDAAVTTLRETRSNILLDSECISKWNSGGNTIYYSSSMICSTGSGTSTTCLGDSGGPLMCLNTETGRWGLRGVVSFGERECLYRSRPDVYSDVSFYKDWLDSIITNSTNS